MEEWRGTIAERAAILEYDGEMIRADAERVAIGEHLERCYASNVQLDGILGELVRAGRSAMHADLRPLLAALGLLNARTSLWGFAAVVPDGGGAYRRAPRGEQGRSALIVPVFDRCRLPISWRKTFNRAGCSGALGLRTF